ncbi:indolepyruvate ferredoxin oxidoreductase family protein [Yunchengibacter salinarum]|uniref:indolepyruvate ferredoxin oxidoreductase family protein n=1 Tax=Yunchengibacter salinarum TaxID=3133399 RepID=UPI0035B66A25
MSTKVTLQDKYTQTEGRVYMNGVQALVRLPIVQRWRDAESGLNTAGFISGYRGSPLGGYDMELDRARKYLESENIVFQPGLNEDLGATAVWGSQMVGIHPDEMKYDGVFGIWYGKGPGLDRSMDVMKHGNAAGSMPHGGVLAICGDDHGAKSSTLPHQADHSFMAAFMPELYPSSIQEFVEFGLLGLAMSRYTGAWVGFKAAAETVETSGTVDLSREKHRIIIPTDFELPEGGLNIRWPDAWREQDWRLQRYKGFAAHAFARANGIDRLIWDSPNPRFGIITSGKSYQDTRQALYEIGIDEDVAKDIGLKLYKVGMPWPLEPEGVRQFCEGLDEVLVVEEKREMIEHQIRWQLYNWKENVRPTVVGKHDEKDQWLLPPENELDVGIIAHVIAARMAKLYDNDEIKKKLAWFADRKRSFEGYEPAINRVPYFCAGCPHNRSTRVPEGSRAMAGIGCHIMAINMERDNETFTQMGGEGVPWIGEAPFTSRKHMFANLGDGTYQHSGILAIRQTVAADVNITFKILYNDAVAMTGGQPVEGSLTVPHIAEQLVAEGVKRVVITSERPEDYALVSLPPGVEVKHRDYTMTVQEELKETEGTTAIIYDQTCAAEKRRRRKRGLMEDPDTRLFINDTVCEGCGDCSVQSNCVAVEPLETEFGRKRAINQSACNKDYSCLKGFCPSFVSVKGATPRKSKEGAGDLSALGLPDLPDPTVPDFDSDYEDYNILVTGIGGTGVLTVGAIMGMAAHLEGKASSILDMTGLAQKGGAVLSHVRIAADEDKLRSPRIVTGRTHTLLACDSIVAAGKDAANVMDSSRTAAVINSHLTPVADFVRNKDIDFQQASVQKQLDAMTREDARHRVPAQELASALMGDAIATNTFVLGYAWQKGLIPLKRESIEEAFRLNKVAADTNLRTFFWGRMAAHDMGAVEKVLQGSVMDTPKLPETLDDVVASRVRLLTDYQNAALARKYTDLVDRVKAAETGVAGEPGALSMAVATYYAKLLAYKDEFEVARLYSRPEFREKLAARFEGDMKLSVHLAPPFLPGRDKATGRPKKREFGAWIFPVFRLLASLRGLRGTPFNLLGYSAERKMERRLIRDYEETVEALLDGLTRDNLALAVEIASLPDSVRGFGPIKEENVRLFDASKATLMERWHKGETQTPEQTAAE